MLPSYGYALHWLAVWKFLDQVSTYIVFNYSELHLTELNLFINLLAEVTGFNAALVLIGPLQFGVLYILHQWDPIVTEAISLMLPFVVLGNVLTVVGEGPHLTAFGMTIGVIIGYFGIQVYRDRKRAGSWTELLQTSSEPLFWQPSS